VYIKACDNMRRDFKYSKMNSLTLSMCEMRKSLNEFYETKVKDIMQTRECEIPCIEENATVAVVFSILNNKDHVWVIDSKNPKQLLGVITESDTIVLLSPPVTSLQTFDKPDSRSLQYGIDLIAEEIMVKKPVTISPDEKIRDALMKMKEQKIKQLPVVDENERLIGEITVKHLIQKYSTQQEENQEKKIEIPSKN
jgi:CBS domain-containing protein